MSGCTPSHSLACAHSICSVRGRAYSISGTNQELAGASHAREDFVAEEQALVGLAQFFKLLQEAFMRNVDSLEACSQDDIGQDVNLTGANLGLAPPLRSTRLCALTKSVGQLNE